MSDVDEDSVWTIPALDILVPAIQKALWRLKAKAPPVVPGAHDYVGRYFNGVNVTLEASVLYMQAPNSTALNMTWVDRDAFRVEAVASSQGCRWLDDGADQEIVYFERDQVRGQVRALRFMGEQLAKLA